MNLSLVGKQNWTYTADQLNIIRQSHLTAEEDLLRIRSEIKDQRELINRQIESLELQSSALETQENDLVEKIERYKMALSPHNKLPLEILRRIFTCCVDEEEVAEIPVTDEVCAYAISRVCSVWRRVAFDTPELWTGISLQLEKENKKQIEVARQWLSRGRTLPRRISIKQDSLDCDSWGNNIILNLVAHFPLRSLELTLPQNQLKQLNGLLDQSLSTLEVLRLKCFSGDVGILPLPFRPADTLLKLNTLILEGKWGLQTLTTVGSWSRIVRLDIKSEISTPQCLEILQQCSQIEYCSLYVQCTGAVLTVPDIILPHLNTMYIYTGGLTTKMLVDALTAPMLKGLAFIPGQSQAPSNVNTVVLCQMIERCQGLKHLTGFWVGATHEPLNPLTLLEKLPHLEAMQISNGMLDEETIKSISLGKVGPNLKRMIFKSRHDANEVLRMVEVRQQNASLNSYCPLARVSSFTEITFNCVAVPSPLKNDLICRKNALEKPKNRIKISLIFD